MIDACIGLGGNLGDREAALREALALLDATPGVRVKSVSSLYETPPWGDEDQGAFLNACAVLETDLAPRALLDRLLGIEAELGRAREKTRRWGPRLIDLDLLDHGGVPLAEEALELPHPRMTQRGFVLIPLAEIAPDLIVEGRRIADWAAEAESDGIEKLGPFPR